MFVLALLFFPGTIVHELSHFFMAKLLFVPAGNISLFPVMEHKGVKLGSVQVAKSDAVRRMLIGVAPFLFGVLLILGILGWAISYHSSLPAWVLFVVSFIVFEIGNTMFSSSNDLEGTVKFLVFACIIGVILYFLHIKLPAIDSRIIPFALMRQLQLYLGIPLGIDVAIILLLKILHRVF